MISEQVNNQNLTTRDMTNKIHISARRWSPGDRSILLARGNVKYGRGTCLHCPRMPGRRGGTTFTLAEVAPSTETFRFLWGNLRMIDAASISSVALTPNSLPSTLLTFCSLLRETYIPRSLDATSNATSKDFYEYRMKREWNEVNILGNDVNTLGAKSSRRRSYFVCR